jgi:hypothetical protein
VNDRVIELLDQIRCGLIDVEDAVGQKHHNQPKWEYLPVRLEDHDIEHSLNTYGADGWEMVNFVRLGTAWYEFIFKRRLS